MLMISALVGVVLFIFGTFIYPSDHVYMCVIICKSIAKNLEQINYILATNFVTATLFYVRYVLPIVLVAKKFC